MASFPAPSPRDRHGFEVALICALPLEASCVQALFDRFWSDCGKAPGDPNVYTVGCIGNHNVVLAHMPGMGATTAAAVAVGLRMSFANIKLALIVGVCGGVPYVNEEEIVLGDVIVSQALIQYDFGRQYPAAFERKDTMADNLGRPSPEIRALQAKLETYHHKQRMEENIATFVEQIYAKLPNTKPPDRKNDVLYRSTYLHKHHRAPLDCKCRERDQICDAALKLECEDLGCAPKMRMPRDRLAGQANIQPMVHLGLMGSGNSVMKSGLHRDQLAMADEIIAFEMEGAGVWDYFPSIVIKGVCDYADSHKRKGWQRHAAATAAACAKAFLMDWTSEDAPPGKPDDRILESLKFDTMEDRIYGISPRYKQTFQWLFSDTSLGFTNWLREGHGIYWITGKAGSGKSTLMKYAFENSTTHELLQAKSPRDKPPFLAHFFFHGRGTPMQKSFKGLLQTILYSILQHYPSLVPQVLPDRPYDDWPLATLNTAFQKIFTRRYGQDLNVCLFIDGLDEFAGKHADIAEFLIDTVQNSVHQVRLCLSSRPLPILQHYFAGYPHLELHKHTYEDIRLLVAEKMNATEQMRSLTRFDPYGTSRFIRDVVDKASGVFLWARLATKSLIEGLNEGEGLKELSVRLEEIPSELSDLFRAMLNAIEPAHLTEAAQVFQILSLARGQATITMVRFALDDPAVALEVGSRAEDANEVRRQEVSTSLRLRKRCAGLVEVLPPTAGRWGAREEAYVQFIHQSVKDFVNQPEIRADLVESSPPGFNAARALLAANLRLSRETPTHTFGDPLMDDIGWYAHLAEKELDTGQLDMLLAAAIARSRQERSGNLSAWMEEYFYRKAAEHRETSMLTFCIWHDLTLSAVQCTDELAGSMTWDELMKLRAVRVFEELNAGRLTNGLDTFRYLGRKGADPNTPVNGENTWHAILNRMYYMSYYDYAKVDLDLIELLLDLGADIQAPIYLDGEFLNSYTFSKEQSVMGKYVTMSSYSLIGRYARHLDHRERSHLKRVLARILQDGGREFYAEEGVPDLREHVWPSYSGSPATLFPLSDFPPARPLRTWESIELDTSKEALDQHTLVVRINASESPRRRPPPPPIPSRRPPSSLQPRPLSPTQGRVPSPSHRLRHMFGRAGRK